MNPRWTVWLAILLVAVAVGLEVKGEHEWALLVMGSAVVSSVLSQHEK